MSKKVLLIVSGIVMLIASSVYYISYSSSKSSAKPTYAIPKKSSTYHFQKLADNPALPAAGTWHTDFSGVSDSNVLGIAGQFNVFAKNIDSRANQGGQNGNFATKNMTAGNTTVNGSKDKISYIQNNITVNGGNSTDLYASKLVLGNSLNFNSNINTLNSYTFNNPKPSDFTQDKGDSKYIDIDYEFTQLSGKSKTIANSTKDNVPVVTNQYGLVTFYATNISAQKNVKYLTVKASDMPGDWGQLDIQGVSSDQQLVITIDTSGVSDFTARYSERTGTDNTKILFNFYNVSENSNFTGTINWGKSTGNVSNAILAPNATVNLLSGAFKGNIIASTININSYNASTDNYPDVPVPQNPDASGTPSSTNPQLNSVPDVNFGSHKLNSETSLIGSWTSKFEMSGEISTDPTKINLSLKNNFTLNSDSNNSDLNKTADVKWWLVKSNYQSGALVSNAEPITNNPASIDFWFYDPDNPERKTGNVTNDVIVSWEHNKKKKTNIFYDIVINNLNAVPEPGDYTATLTWQLANVP